MEHAIFRNAPLFANWRGDLDWRDRVPATQDWLNQMFPALEAAERTHPFSRFEQVSDAQKSHNYLALPTELLAFMRGIPLNLQAPYLCSLLLWHMGTFDERFSAAGLDSEFALHYADTFNRIIDDIKADPEFARIGRDTFLKDLWLARVVMIPAVAQVWWPRSGLSFRQLAGAGAATAARILLRTGGRRPFLEGHTHDRLVAQGYWSKEGWLEALRLAALALEAFRTHKGVFSTAWYFDPAMERISPHLSFTAELQLDRGARRFRVGSSPTAVANATAKSRSRRSLYFEGQYLPTNFCVCWARHDLLSAFG